MSLFARLWPYYRAYWRLFVPGLVCAIVSAVFAVLAPAVVRQALDAIPVYVAQHRSGAAGAGLWGPLSGMLALKGGIILGLAVLSGGFSFLTRQTLVVASRHIEFDIRETLYAALQALPPAFYRALSTGDVITRASSDVEQVRRAVGPALMYASRAVTLVVLAIGAMLVISPGLTLWALLPMPFLAVSVFFVARLEYTRSEAIQKQYSALTSRVQEAFAGIRVVKAYTREAGEGAAFEAEAERLRVRNLALARVEAAWTPIFVLLVGMSALLVVWQGGRQAIAGTVTVGNIAEFLIYVALMTWPVASMGFILSMIQRAAASMKRLAPILDAVPAIRDAPGVTDASVTEIRGALAFENVTVRYAAGADGMGGGAGGDGASAATGASPGDGRGLGPAVLDGVSFSVGAGQTLGIVGRTGSGKTTLAALIPRLLDPTEGRVLVDGRDARTIPLAVLRGATGVVPQEVFLFSDTIGGNIAFGRMDAGLGDLRRASAEADLLENVERFPAGFDTVVGERGITLSGGQKQRTALARALVREPRILILDDALSAVDTQTERRILDALRARRGRQTLVVVAHRVSAVQEADLILVLDEGRIAEQGTHADLMARGGLYANLYAKQQLEAELADAA